MSSTVFNNPTTRASPMNPSDRTNFARNGADAPVFDDLREQFEKLSSEWKDRAAECADQAKAWVIKYPGTSLAVAAGAGLLLGLMVKRK
jgi:ElaB/YqjD/DUF883 family membrane-anchored ribosome-binding protein